MNKIKVRLPSLMHYNIRKELISSNVYDIVDPEFFVKGPVSVVDDIYLEIKLYFRFDYDNKQ